MSLRRWMAAGRRTLSGALAFVLTAILILGNVQFTFAGEASERFFKEGSGLTDDEGYSTATLSNASLANEENTGLTVSVFSEDSDFRPGGDVTLEVHVKNDTGETITDGQISYRASGIDKDSAYFEILDESVVSSYEDFETYEDTGIDDSADIELELDIDPVAAAKHAISDAVHAVKEKLFGGDADNNEDEEDEKPIKIKDIDLAPGEIYSARFHFEISDSIEKAKNQNVKFFFRGMGEEEDRHFGQGEFLYTVSYLNLDPVEFEEGNAIYTGEEVTMGLRTTMYDFDAILTDSFTDTVASPSDATASPSDAAKATASPSDAQADDTITVYEDEITNGYIVDLEETSYRIEMTDARLKGLDVHKALVNDVNDNLLLCSFHVAKDTEPGIYFGKIIQESKTKNTTYRSSQGFSLIVEGEGEVTLQGSLGDTTVTVSGPAGAFPEAEELEVRVSELDDETRAKMEEEIQKKAAELGESVRGYILMDVSLYADGVEIQPEDSVEVTFEYNQEELKSNVTEESLGEVETGSESKKTSRKRVFHFNESEQTVEVLENWENETGEVVARTDSFSPFMLLSVEEDESSYFTFTNGNITATVTASDDLKTALKNYGSYQFRFDILQSGDEYTNALDTAQAKLGELTIKDDEVLDLYFYNTETADRIDLSREVEITLSFANSIFGGYVGGVLQTYSDGKCENVLVSAEKSDSAFTKMIIQTSSGLTSDSLFVMYAVDQGETGSELDGDYAYLSDVSMVADTTTTSGYAIRTGTASWDGNDDAGNDSTDLNNVLRTYDIAAYTVTFTSRVRDNAPYKNYYQGNLYFEFILPGDSSEIQFEEGSMGWLLAKNAVYTITEEEVDGKTCQVLRGYYSWQPSSGNDHAIGESTQELTLAIRALALSNGDEIEPTFTFWLEGNDVGVDYSDWGTEDHTGDIVTGNGASCSAHDETEYRTITAPKITVSARASYNVAIVSASTSKCQSVGTFDFSTGNDLALNQDAGSVYGRMGAYGIIIQIVELSSGEGLKGVELPKSGEDITFDLSLTSTYKYTDENGRSVTLSLSDESLDSAYTPLIWSFDANITGSTQKDGRTIPVSTKCADTAPLNKLGETTTAYYYNSCYDGGSWSIEQNNDGTYTVTVSDCVVDMSQIPYTNQAGNVNSTTYYDPDSVNNYWEIGTACISAGEMWIVQPFYETDEDTPSDTTGTYIVDEYGDGTFTTVLSDTSLSMITASGATLNVVTDNTNQAVTSDDKVSQSMAITKPGTISQQIQYLKYNYNAYNNPLTDGCWGTGQDWILAGDNLTIGGWVSHDSAEGGYTGVAYDVLIKFDNAFFEPTSVVASKVNGGSVTVMYAGKVDGWEHTDNNGDTLAPDEDGYDTDMIYADIDDLVYFSSVSALESAGYTCVGVLLEYRGLVTEQMNHIHYYIKGSCKSDVKADYVYMVTHCCRAWNREELAEAAGLDLSDILAMTTTEDVNALVNTYIPMVSDSSTPDYSSYPTTYWINGGEDGVGTQSDNIRNYTKPHYDESGYVAGTEGYLWGDSCLVVGYTTNVDLSVAQTTTGGADKAAYDMDTYQRVVDYALEGSIIRNNGTFTTDTSQKTTVTMTVTLPDGLTYLEGSSYIGGTYTTNGEGKQGTVTDGTKLLENDTVTVYDENENELYTVKFNLAEDTATGETILTYTLTGVTLNGDLPQYLDTIYFSCQIGTEGNEETDVQNGDSLTASAMIESTEDDDRDFTAANGNYSECGILISKNNAAALSKFADQSVVEVGEPMGFMLNVANNSTNATSVRAVEALPYSTDGASSFNGDVVVTEFRVYSSADKDDSGSYTYTDSEFAERYAGFKFYYTTDGDYRGKDSEELENEDFTNTDNWTELDFNSDGTAVLPEGDFTPVAIVALGTLQAGTTLRMHIEIVLPDGEGGDYINNTLSNYNLSTSLSSTARSRVISRTLSGLAWFDLDGDGYQDDGEETINNVWVALLKLTEDGDANDFDDYEAVTDASGNPIVISAGKTYDVQSNEEGDINKETYKEGSYEFTSLSAGTYAVQFYTSDNKGNLKFIDEDTQEIYWASPQNAYDDGDGKDSDATGVYVGGSIKSVPAALTNKEKKDGLQCTWITGIVMPEASDLTYGTYSSPNHDSGVYKPIKRLRVVKYVIKNDELNEPIPSNYKFLINVADSDDTFATTLALGTKEDIERTINLDGQGGATTFTIDETVPMEYEVAQVVKVNAPDISDYNDLDKWETGAKAMRKEVIDSLDDETLPGDIDEISSNTGYGDITASKSVTIYPGDDVTVIVTNQPAHISYFHHTASVTNSNTENAENGFAKLDNYYDEDEDSENNTTDDTETSADVDLAALIDYKAIKRNQDDQEGGERIHEI